MSTKFPWELFHWQLYLGFRTTADLYQWSTRSVSPLKGTLSRRETSRAELCSQLSGSYFKSKTFFVGALKMEDAATQTLFHSPYLCHWRQMVLTLTARVSWSFHSRNSTVGRRRVLKTDTHTHTYTHLPIKSFSLSQQEPCFDVYHIRRGPRLEIKHTPPPPLSLHLDIPAAEIQLAELHTQNLPGETLQRDRTV